MSPCDLIRARDWVEFLCLTSLSCVQNKDRRTNPHGCSVDLFAFPALLPDDENTDGFVVVFILPLVAIVEPHACSLDWVGRTVFSSKFAATLYCGNDFAVKLDSLAERFVDDVRLRPSLRAYVSPAFRIATFWREITNSVRVIPDFGALSTGLLSGGLSFTRLRPTFVRSNQGRTKPFWRGLLLFLLLRLLRWRKLAYFFRCYAVF